MINGMQDHETEEPTDWHAIALELAQRVKFAIANLKCQGAGLLIDMESGKSQHWREYMADGMEKIPGLVVNRDMMHTFDLPRNRQKKTQQAIRDKQAKDKEVA